MKKVVKDSVKCFMVFIVPVVACLSVLLFVDYNFGNRVFVGQIRQKVTGDKVWFKSDDIFYNNRVYEVVSLEGSKAVLENINSGLVKEVKLSDGLMKELRSAMVKGDALVMDRALTGIEYAGVRNYKLSSESLNGLSEDLNLTEEAVAGVVGNLLVEDSNWVSFTDFRVVDTYSYKEISSVALKLFLLIFVALYAICTFYAFKAR